MNLIYKFALSFKAALFQRIDSMQSRVHAFVSIKPYHQIHLAHTSKYLDVSFEAESRLAILAANLNITLITGQLRQPPAFSQSLYVISKFVKIFTLNPYHLENIQ